MPDIRFTLDAADFEEWPVIRARFPAWTPEHIQQLEAAPAARGEDPRTWCCRVDPLPLDKVLATPIKTRTTPWQPLPAHSVHSIDADTRVLFTDDDAYLSKRFFTDKGAAGQCMRAHKSDFAEGI